MSTRLTDRLTLLADASFTAWMRRRDSRGQRTVKPATVRAVVWALVQHSDSSGVSYPSVETLSRESDASRATVKRVVSMLREDGVVRVRARNRGAAAGRKLGESMEGCSNVYTIVWDRFAELREGGALAVDGDQNTAQIEPCSGAEQGSTGAVNTAQQSAEQGSVERGTGLRLSRKPSMNRPENQPPQPPAVRGEPTGGGGESVVQQADRVVAEYPESDSPLPVADHAAVVEAIHREAELVDGATADEIVAAAREVASARRDGQLHSVLWLRTWARNRGYWPTVLRARWTAEARSRRDGRPTLSADAESERLRIASEQDAAIETLDRLDEPTLMALRDRTIAGMGTITGAVYADLDPRTSRRLRTLMAADLAERGMPSVAKEPVPA